VLTKRSTPAAAPPESWRELVSDCSFPCDSNIFLYSRSCHSITLAPKLGFLYKTQCLPGNKKTPTHRRENTPQNFQKITQKDKKKKHLDKIKLECVPEKSKNEERLQKLLVSRETHLKKTPRKLLKKRENRKKTLEIWKSPSDCQIKRKRKYEEERSERRRKICNYLVRDISKQKCRQNTRWDKMKQNIYNFTSSIITLSISKCSQNVIKMIDEEISKQNISTFVSSLSLSLSQKMSSKCTMKGNKRFPPWLSLSLSQSDLPHSSTTPKNGKKEKKRKRKKRNKISKPTLKLERNGTQNAWYYQKALHYGVVVVYIPQTQRNFA